jgi:transcriptional regulator GlxA family with amidase domain
VGDELSLATVALQRHDDVAGGVGGDRRAVVTPDQVQTEVQPGGDAGGGEELAVVHEQHAGIDLDARMAPGQLLGEAPVGDNDRGTRRSSGGGPDMHVQILMFQGVEELDAIGPYEVFAYARRLGAPVDPVLVAAGESGPVVARHGTEITVGAGWSPESADVVVVPGGGYADRSPQGVWAEIQRGKLPAVLRAAPRPGLIMASVCSGAMLLSAAGLTKGRPCTTHRSALQDLDAEGANLVDARVVDDGDLVTAGGVTSGLDLALWLLERELGAELAVAVEQQLEYERRGTVWRRRD